MNSKALVLCIALVLGIAPRASAGIMKPGVDVAINTAKTVATSVGKNSMETAGLIAQSITAPYKICIAFTKLFLRSLVIVVPAAIVIGLTAVLSDCIARKIFKVDRNATGWKPRCLKIASIAIAATITAGTALAGLGAISTYHQTPSGATAISA